MEIQYLCEELTAQIKGSFKDFFHQKPLY